MPKLMPLIQPPATITEEYDARLRKLIKQMSHSVNYWITAAYHQDKAGELAQDAEGETIMQAFNRRAAQWRRTVDKRADTIARWFVTDSAKNLKTRRVNMFRKMGFTIKPSYTRDEMFVIEDAIYESTSLIKKIQAKYMDDVRDMLEDAIAESRDLNYIMDRLAERTEISLRRASFIARDQSNKIHNDLSMSQDKSVGVTEGIWIHIPGEKTARHTHVLMDGKRFRLDEGLMDDDEKVNRMVKPAELPGCACMYRALMPSVEEILEVNESE